MGSKFFTIINQSLRPAVLTLGIVMAALPVMAAANKPMIGLTPKTTITHYNKAMEKLNDVKSHETLRTAENKMNKSIQILEASGCMDEGYNDSGCYSINAAAFKNTADVMDQEANLLEAPIKDIETALRALQPEISKMGKLSPRQWHKMMETETTKASKKPRYKSRRSSTLKGLKRYKAMLNKRGVSPAVGSAALFMDLMDMKTTLSDIVTGLRAEAAQMRTDVSLGVVFSGKTTESLEKMLEKIYGPDDPEGAIPTPYGTQVAASDDGAFFDED